MSENRQKLAILFIALILLTGCRRSDGGRGAGYPGDNLDASKDTAEAVAEGTRVGDDQDNQPVVPLDASSEPREATVIPSRIAVDGAENGQNGGEGAGEPPPTSEAGPADACPVPEGWSPYTVQMGDTLGEIAGLANTPIEELVTANCLEDPNALFSGQTLFVPVPIASSTDQIPSSPPAYPGWIRTSDPLYQVSFQYPQDWVDASEGPMHRWEGEDGFVILSAEGSPHALDIVADNHAEHVLLPFGPSPTVEEITLVDGRPGILILPSEDNQDEPERDAAFITQYAEPVPVGTYRHNYLVLNADPGHIRQIASSIEMPEPPDSTGIDLFDVSVEDLRGGGKRITFRWDSHGATRGTITSGSAQRFIPWWPVEAFGELTVDLNGTIFPNPAMTLLVFNDINGEEARRSINIDWPCKHGYFFSPYPERCPVYAPLTVSGAFQRFQRGFMIWLPRPDLEQPTIYAFIETGRLMVYPDNWNPGEPEMDPDLIAPEGLFQPVRGFGKAWREQDWLQDELGWATSPEEAYDVTFQYEFRESIPGVGYITHPDGSILKITDGSWTVHDPSQSSEGEGG